MPQNCSFMVEARGLEPPNLLTASQALYQLSYAPCELDFTSATELDLPPNETGWRVTRVGVESSPSPFGRNFPGR